jgi:hypothetical protein
LTGPGWAYYAMQSLRNHLMCPREVQSRRSACSSSYRSPGLRAAQAACRCAGSLPVVKTTFANYIRRSGLVTFQGNRFGS